MKYTPDFSSRFRILKGGKISLVVSAVIAGSTMSFASPAGGTVTTGGATINQNGSVTTINQSTNKASINWNSFSIAPTETVNFVQPSSQSVALNRVIGTTQSLIEGSMNANGQVFLINPNGVLFANGSQINVGGLVASTLNITDENFQSGNYLFDGNSGASVLNMGTITASNGGYVAMMGKTVANEGTIVATMGNVQLASGEKISLNLNGNSLVKLTIDQGTMDALVENKGLIRADGGQVYLTTQALNTILDGMVNNTGIIEAKTLNDVTGKVILYAHGGTANISGEIKAEGGFVETSGERLHVSDATVIKAKTWLLDPTNITVASVGSEPLSGTPATTTTAGDVTVSGATINASLNNGTSVLLDATNNITINDNISKTNGSDATLTFKAGGNIVLESSKTIASTSNKLNTVFWADSDATSGGSIYLKNGSSITTNGGHLWMGGGSGTTTWNGLSVGDGYAIGTSAGIDLTNTTLGITNDNYYGAGNRYHYNGITLLNSNINTSGGDFKASGKSHNAQVTTNKAYIGVFIGGDYQISTSAGDIVLDGISAVSANDNSWYNGVALGSANVAGDANPQLITTDGDIIITGEVNQNFNVGHPRAISLAVWGVTNKLNLKTTTGNISLTGDNKSTVSNSANRAIGNDVDGYRFTEISSSTGNINITGIGANTGGYDIGFKNAIIKTDGTITFIGDTLNILSSYSTGSQISSVTNGIGSLVIKPYTDSTTIGIGGATGTLALASSYFSTNFLDGFSSITIGDATAGDITIGGTTTYNDNLTFKTKGNISTDASASLTANGANSLVFWVDSDANSDGMIYLKNGSSITTNGGDITLSGGSDITTGYATGNAQNSNGVTLDNVDLLSGGGDILIRGKSGTAVTSVAYSVGTFSNLDGIRLHGGNTLNSGDGTITIVGESVATTATANNGIELSHSISDLITSSNTGANAIVLNGTSGSSASSNAFGIYTWLATIQATNGGGIYLKGNGQKDDGVTIASGSSVLANSGKITLEGTGYGTSAKAVNIGGVVGQKSGSSVTSSSSNIEIIGNTFGASGTLQSSESLIIKPYTASTTIGIGGVTGTLALASSYFNTNFVDGFSSITVGSADAGTITLEGTTNYNNPLMLKTADSIIFNASSSLVGLDANDPSLILWSDADANSNGGTWLQSTSSITTNGGSVTIGGGANPVTDYAFGADLGALDNGESNAGYRGATINGNIAANGGNIIINGEGSALASSTRGVSIAGDISTTGSGTIAINGIAKGTSDGVGTSGTISSENGNITLIGTKDTGTNGTNVSGGSISATGSGNIFLTSLSGTIGLVGNVSTNTGTITLNSATALSQGAGVLSGNALVAAGTSAYTLTNTSNAMSSLSSSNTLASLSYVDSNALSLGAIASGAIDIATLTGDLTLNGNIATSSTANDAITLNAGKDTASGTSTGGNIIHTSGTVTTGTNGRATLYSGGVSGSTGLTTLIGSGSGKFRYNSDETSTNYTTALSNGTYVIYREQPTITIAPETKSIAYGDADPSFTFTSSGYENGDTNSILSGTGSFTTTSTKSTSNKYIAGTYDISYSSGFTNGLGYAIEDKSSVTDEFTVSKANLVVSGITASNKVYDALTTATLGGTAAITALGSDSVTLGGTAAGTFATKDAGTAKAITITGNTISGTDADNYNLVQQAGLTADITKANLVVSGITASNKVYDALTTATLGGTAAITALGSDSVTLGGTAAGTFATKDAGTAKAITITGNTISGTDADNYNLVQQAGLTADITKADATVTAASDTKTYNGVAQSVTGFTATGLVNNETISVLSGVSGATATGTNAGTYNTALSGTDENYNLTFVDGKLTILAPAGNPVEDIVTTIVNQTTVAPPASVAIVPTAPQQSSQAQTQTTSLLQAIMPSNSGETFSLVGTTDGMTPVQTVSMEQLQSASGGQGANEIRVALGQDSFVELVNGGVNLPLGLSQEFYVLENIKNKQN